MRAIADLRFGGPWSGDAALLGEPSQISGPDWSKLRDCSWARSWGRRLRPPVPDPDRIELVHVDRQCQDIHLWISARLLQRSPSFDRSAFRSRAATLEEERSP